VALNLPEAYRLSELEEVVGTLHSITITDIGLVAVIGWISVWLPDDLEEMLKSLNGRRVAILRLDGYHVRCLEDENKSGMG
jgi:hypothetical protein